MSAAPPTQLSSFLSRGYAQAHDRAIWDSLLHMIGGDVGLARARSSNPPLALHLAAPRRSPTKRPHHHRPTTVPSLPQPLRVTGCQGRLDRHG